MEQPNNSELVAGVYLSLQFWLGNDLWLSSGVGNPVNGWWWWVGLGLSNGLLGKASFVFVEGAKRAQQNEKRTTRTSPQLQLSSPNYSTQPPQPPALISWPVRPWRWSIYTPEVQQRVYPWKPWWETEDDYRLPIGWNGHFSGVNSLLNFGRVL